MERRLFLLVACIVLVTGCTGRDARRAETLLQRAESAQESLASTGIEAEITVVADGKKAGITFDGAGYLSGPWAGNFYVRMHGLGSARTSVQNVAFVRRGGTVTIRVNGRRQTLSAPAAESELGSGVVDFSTFTDLAKYVESVSVDEVRFRGRPVDRITGTVDTQAMLEGLGGFGADALTGAAVHFGNIRATLFVPRDTHLVEAMFVDMDMTGNGHKAHMRLALALDRVNQQVVFPRI